MSAPFFRRRRVFRAQGARKAARARGRRGAARRTKRCLDQGGLAFHDDDRVPRAAPKSAAVRGQIALCPIRTARAAGMRPRGRRAKNRARMIVEAATLLDPNPNAVPSMTAAMASTRTRIGSSTNTTDPTSSAIKSFK